MRKTAVALTLAAAMAVWAAGPLVPAAWGQAAQQPAPVGVIVLVTGSVQLGRDGAWQPAVVKIPVFEGQTLKTGPGSSVEVLFDVDTPARLGEQAEIKVADLLLKARLERTKAKIAAPADAQKVEMQVTPLTGVRGTEKTEEKAGDLKREHYWDENAAPAK